MADPQSQNLPPIGQPLPDNGQYTFGSSTSQTNGNLPPIGKPLDESQYTFGPSNQPTNQSVSPQPDQNKVSTGVYETAIKPAVDTAKQVVQKPIDLYHQAVDAYKAGDWKTGTERATRLLTVLPMFPGTNYEALADAAKQLIMQPVNEIEHGYKQKKDQGASTSQAVVQTATHALPVIGPMMANIEDVINKHLDAKEYKAAVGNVIGAVGSLGLLGLPEAEVGEGVSNISEGADRGLGRVRPGTTDIAGVKVPVSTASLGESQSNLSKLLNQATSTQGAQKFIDQFTQPKVVEANTANLGQAASKSIDRLRELRNELPVAPRLKTVDDVANWQKQEAQKTYKVLDEAAKPDIDSWNSMKERWEAENPKPQATPQGPTPFAGTKPTVAENAAKKAQFRAKTQEWNDAQEQWLDEHPQPKTFTELQDQIRNATRVANSKSPLMSNVDRQAAIKSLPGYKQEMSDFMSKHGDLVDPNELNAANQVYSQYDKTQWIADKIRTATNGTDSVPSKFKQEPSNLNLDRLKNLEGQFDNEYGAGEWSKLLGPQGVRNYKDMINVLKNPVEYGKLREVLGHSLAGGITSFIPRTLADNLLFNPTYGQTVLKAIKNIPRVAGQASVVGQAAKTPDTTPVKRAVYNTATGLAGNGQ